MFRKIEDFSTAWKSESAATQKIMDALTDQSLQQSIADGHRTIGRIAWHICQTIPEMMGRTGLTLEGPGEDSTTPSSAAEIQKAYKQASESLAREIQSQWTDETLAVTDDMYGETWARCATLMALIVHEVHHRGQLTVLMRQAGLNVPGVYGPSKEEWANYGMEAPAV